MSTYEAAYKSLLQGVSQQLPAERLEGQVTAQVNMVSDPVTNLRRRPGVIMQKSWNWPGATDSNILAWFSDLAGARVHILLNTATGNIRILNEDYVEEANLNGGAYLTNTNLNRIRATTVGNEFYLCNVDVIPTLQYSSSLPDPTKAGFFYILGGAFSKTYDVTVVYPTGQTTATYTTPSGASPGDAALATPEYIATQLANQLTAAAVGLTVTRDGPYVFVQRSTTIAVNTTNSTAYEIASKGGMVTSAGNLPARLPSVANGYICRVGQGNDPQYYVYSASTTEWLETSSYGSPTSITNCPVNIAWNGTAWFLDTSPFEGRLAGDDDSNPVHDFMQYGISGMGTYQGRLVLMSGPLVSLSASGTPRRFFRSTVTSVINSDAIEIGSGLNSSAAYEWCIGFQKDLILFSRMYQAVLPSGNTAITPSTATVVPTSGHEVDTTSGPVNLGRTLMYCNPRSSDFFGVMEMIPSPYTDSQYVSQDSTPHLPKYMSGRCRFAVSSGVASMAMFAPLGDPYSLMIHEYHWNGDTKDQQAWHQWTFAYPVAQAYFIGDVSVVVFVKNEQIVLGTVDARAGAVDSDGIRRPFLDLAFQAEIVDHVITIPSWITAFEPSITASLRVVAGTGDLAGEEIGIASKTTSTMTTVLSWPEGTALLGLTYYSGMIPTPPQVTDYQGGVIHTGKATLHRFTMGTRNSSDFLVAISDAYMTDEAYSEATLTFSSPELELGRGLFADISQNIIPCRTDMRTTSMEVYTEGTGEFNITSLEYVAKYNPKIKRR